VSSIYISSFRISLANNLHSDVHSIPSTKDNVGSNNLGSPTHQFPSVVWRANWSSLTLATKPKGVNIFNIRGHHGTMSQFAELPVSHSISVWPIVIWSYLPQVINFYEVLQSKPLYPALLYLYMARYSEPTMATLILLPQQYCVSHKILHYIMSSNPQLFCLRSKYF
jgi:hypothetical protein